MHWIKIVTNAYGDTCFKSNTMEFLFRNPIPAIKTIKNDAIVIHILLGTHWNEKIKKWNWMNVACASANKRTVLTSFILLNSIHFIFLIQTKQKERNSKYK